MLKAWLELPGSVQHFAEASKASNVDLVSHGTTSDADTIRNTAIAQPLIVAMSLFALRAALDGRTATEAVDVTAGHSVGELSAAAVAGVVSDAGAAGLVSRRAHAMAAAAASASSGMSAVVGGDPGEVTAAIEGAGLWPANVNGAGQIVAAGAMDKLAALTAHPPTRARVIPLQVAGAFHTPFMDAARMEFEPVALTWDASDPTLPFLADIDGSAYTGGTHGHGSGADVLGNLARQVTAPVRWDLVMHSLAERGVTGVLELAPGGVLTGLVRRALKGVETVAMKSPDDLDTVRAFIAAHSNAISAPSSSTGATQ